MIDKCSVVTADDKDYTLLVSKLVAKIVSLQLEGCVSVDNDEG